MGQFMQTGGFPRTYVLVSLYRLTSRDPHRLARPVLRVWDAVRAVTYAPAEIGLGVARFCLGYLDDEFAAHPPNAADRELAHQLLDGVVDAFSPGRRGTAFNRAEYDEVAFLAQAVHATIDR